MLVCLFILWIWYRSNKLYSHKVLFGRNLLEALRVAEANQVMDMLDAGGRLTYVDVRQSITGLKAARFFQVRPGTDYALALGIINGVIKNRPLCFKSNSSSSQLCSDSR